MSSAAAAARRNLVERMLIYGEKELLGIEGYPPERSMYESVLKATGLHREKAPGVWCFGPPSEESSLNALPTWRKLGDLIFQAEPEPHPLNEIFKALADPPYGVMEGLHPVLLCAFMMTFPDEITLYREGTFIPEPGIAEFEVLMRRPELFAIAGSRVIGPRLAVVERLAKGLGCKPATVSVVRTMFRMVKGLPEYAWSTKRLSENTLRMRDAFEKAKSPEKFLYVDLPNALGLSSFSEINPDPNLVEQFFIALNASLQEWKNVAPDTIKRAKEALLQACALEVTDAGWKQLREAAVHLELRMADALQRTFLRRVIEATNDDAGISSILALVANRPPANWTDSDVERFPNLAQALVDPIRKAMTRAELENESQDLLAHLSTDQRERVKVLTEELTRELSISQQENGPEILRAALLLLADKLAKDCGVKK